MLLHGRHAIDAHSSGALEGAHFRRSVGGREDSNPKSDSTRVDPNSRARRVASGRPSFAESTGGGKVLPWRVLGRPRLGPGVGERSGGHGAPRRGRLATYAACGRRPADVDPTFRHLRSPDCVTRREYWGAQPVRRERRELGECPGIDGEDTVCHRRSVAPGQAQHRVSVVTPSSRANFCGLATT